MKDKNDHKEGGAVRSPVPVTPQPATHAQTDSTKDWEPPKDRSKSGDPENPHATEVFGESSAKADKTKQESGYFVAPGKSITSAGRLSAWLITESRPYSSSPAPATIRRATSFWNISAMDSQGADPASHLISSGVPTL